jgi:NAD(P)-dependent dehydrogenase (short-subunit alcohol dehydrogenase family)
MSDQTTQDMRGRTVVVTGASAGIGAAARQFADLGATVAVVGRSAQKTAAVADTIGAEAHFVDYSRLDDVRRLADELLARYPRIDVLANNAGGVFSGRNTSADGHEMTFQVNHLAPFLLTNLLLDRLTTAPEGAWVINTASAAYRRSRVDLDDLDRTFGRYSGSGAYGTTKLANVLFTRELARRMQGTGVTTAAFHRFKPEEPKNKQATDPHLAQQLWERSAQLTGVRVSS